MFFLYKNFYHLKSFNIICRKYKIIETEKEKERLERGSIIYVNGRLRKIDKGSLEDIHRCERRLCYFYDSARRLTETMEKVDE
jgi:hypothetical protein